jgi:hypothetical protein
MTDLIRDGLVQSERARERERERDVCRRLKRGMRWETRAFQSGILTWNYKWSSTKSNSLYFYFAIYLVFEFE